MSTRQALRNLADELGADLEREFSGTGAIVELNPSASKDYQPPAPIVSAEKLGRIQRTAVAKYRQMIADIRKQTTATVASLEADKKTLRRQFDEEMQDLDDRIEEAQRKAAEDVAAAERIVRSAEAALAALDVE